MMYGIKDQIRPVSRIVAERMNHISYLCYGHHSAYRIGRVGHSHDSSVFVHERAQMIQIHLSLIIDSEPAYFHAFSLPENELPWGYVSEVVGIGYYDVVVLLYHGMEGNSQVQQAVSS